MTILPVPPASPPPTTDTLHTERMARLDSCINACGNTEAPSSVWEDGSRGFIANYLCTDCGEPWSTSWSEC